MVVEEVVNVTNDTLLGGLVTEIGQIGLWLQAIGVIVVVWVIVWIIQVVINWKRIKMIKRFKEDIDRIEKKIDKLSKKIK
jgi:hypothetical protein